ncbi:MAG: hypothetical protein H6625_04995 [Bdellovibrionaceae bacterium]|nr:hypothetical protein [Pseudobdellovibrionaceae bacterium]
MRKIIHLLVAFLVFYLIYGLFITQYEINIVRPTITRIHPENYFDYSGVLNIHSIKSTGSGTYSEILEAAKKSGLDFIFINDVNDVDVDKSYEKYYDHLLVFIDSEYSYLDSRVLFYGKNDYSNFSSLGQAQAMIADRLSEKKSTDLNDGVMVLAHPFKKGHMWQGDIPVGFNGIEVLNLKSVWQNTWQENKLSFFWSLLIYPFNPELSLLRMFPFPNQEFELWDELNKKQKTYGFAGADAEAKLKFPRNLKVPSYETLFNIIRTHVLLSSELTGDFKSDSNKIKQALKRGHFYISLDKMANPTSFNAIVSNDKDTYMMGDSINWSEKLRLSLRFAQKPLYPIDIMIFKDGKKVFSTDSLDATYTLPDRGIYRVVVRIIPTFPLPDGKKWVPWIITNPFFVK